ncbi:PRTRC system protein C [Massilia sp. Root418]|uniref:PRTRC system protein C n=1 Tax=Massilia sp. Root418 TaxID=1736532 RepID=UPI0009E9F35B|nr:PRTRC system protein C [Massilia sp. Root418]
MSITTQELQREFKYNSVKLADPNPAFSLSQVRDFYANVYPEITSADIEGPEVVGNKNTYSFRRAVGTKGQKHIKASIDGARRLVVVAPVENIGKLVRDLAELDNIGWFHSEPRAHYAIRHTQALLRQCPPSSVADSTVSFLRALHLAHCSVAQEVHA